jgi:toxin ParE1/3/4
MGTYKIHYLTLAEKDLLEILQYISHDRPRAALDLLDEIDNSISRLETFPLTGAVLRDRYLQRLGYRILTVDKILVFYVVKGNTVEIRRILHGARRYEFLL